MAEQSIESNSFSGEAADNASEKETALEDAVGKLASRFIRELPNELVLASKTGATEVMIKYESTDIPRSELELFTNPDSEAAVMLRQAIQERLAGNPWLEKAANVQKIHMRVYDGATVPDIWKKQGA